MIAGITVAAVAEISRRKGTDSLVDKLKSWKVDRVLPVNFLLLQNEGFLLKACEQGVVSGE